MRMGPPELLSQRRKYPTIFTPNDAGQTDSMIHPTSVSTYFVSPQLCLLSSPVGLTICTTIHVALFPVLELSQAKHSIAMSCKAYPPIGIALISDTENRELPSWFFTSFCFVSINLRDIQCERTRKRIIQVFAFVAHDQKA